MHTKKRLPFIILLMNLFLFIGLQLFFENIWLESLVVNILQLIAATFAIIWLIKGYYHVHPDFRFNRILLAIGLSIYMYSSALWLYGQITEKLINFQGVSYIIYLLSYLFFFIALLRMTKQFSHSAIRKSFGFNITIFMITSIAIILHFLIKPSLLLPVENVLLAFAKISFPILDISMMFIILVLYYTNKYIRLKVSLNYLISGFAMLVIGDIGYGYVLLLDSTLLISTVTFIWTIGIWLLGFAALYGKEVDFEFKNEETESALIMKESSFPYIGTVILVLFAVFTQEWEFTILSFAVVLLFFMILGRHYYILNKNYKLILDYQTLAYRDPLTNLNNRASFFEKLEKYLSNHNNDKKVALLLLDLDRFKMVNDTLGHFAGDLILKKTAERLRACSQGNPIFRLGGDEFIIILPDADFEKCASISEAILTKFQNPFTVDGNELIVTPSIGISMYPDDALTGEGLFKFADAALYLAKEQGKNGFEFFNEELNRTIVHKSFLENELRKAVKNNQLEIYYQPKVHLQKQEIIGAEALLRWNHPELGNIPPKEFIPIAEETGQITSIGEWVLMEACKQNKAWQEQGLPPICMAVNVSGIQFQHSNFVFKVQKALQETDLEAKYLEIEITESIMQNTTEVRNIINQLKEVGVEISIDDLGTGYSSLSLLRQLPIDTIKIDKSFIEDISEQNQSAFIKSIIDLGLTLNLKVVAEGVEKEHQLEILNENRCTYGQGYLFSRPIPADDFKQFLESKIAVENSLR